MEKIASLYLHLQHLLFDSDRIPLAMAAILLTVMVGMVTGPVFSNTSPFVWQVVSKVLGGFGVRLDRVQRNPNDLIMRGFFLTVMGLVLVYFMGRGAADLVKAYPLKGATEIVLLSLTMCAGSVWYALLRFFFVLKDKKKVLKNVYYTMAISTRTDLTAADNFTMTRVGMGLAARSFDKGIVAPVIWYLIGGLPLAYIYAGVAALAWRFGRDGFTRGFGRIPLILDELMGFVPSAFSGFLMAGAGALTPTAGLTRAIMGLMRPEGKTPYAEGGLVITAMANALKVAMGGPIVDLDGRSIQRTWAGPKGATAKLDAGHLRRALYITVMAHLLFLVSMGAILMLAPRPASMMPPAGLVLENGLDHTLETQPLNKDGK